MTVSTGELDVAAVRSHFDFVATGRVVTNNAASTQPPHELVALYRSLAPWYDRRSAAVHLAGRRVR
jgi:cysteine desulfurase/selenocysteine lyase